MLVRDDIHLHHHLLAHHQPVQVQQAHKSGHIDPSVLNEPLAWISHADIHEPVRLGRVLHLPARLHDASLPACDHPHHLQLPGRPPASDILQDVSCHLAKAQLEGALGPPPLQLPL